jgi:3'(2'), 5'-bisphosphate nucleotidase
VIDLEFLGNLSREAGKAIMEVYGTSFSVETKADRSPLTLADKKSHEIISGALLSRYPDIPVLSEEGKEAAYSTRQGWSRFWLVDPLDGTKEFIKRNGEFTVNIALVEGSTPIVGVIYIPAMDLLYMADTREGCWEYANGERRSLRMQPHQPGTPVRVVKSRSHPSPGLEAIFKCLPSYEIIGRGSALKFCTMAAGGADFYPRFGPTWEWDTAAGHAIITAAGGTLVDLHGKPFLYNKENLVNGPFMAASSLEWLEATGILDVTRALSLT